MRDKLLARLFISSFAVCSNSLSAPRSGAFTGSACGSRHVGFIGAFTCLPICQGTLSPKVMSGYLSQ